MNAGRDQDRDRAIEQLLRRSGRSSAASPSDQCLDAESVAAWFDGGLDDHARTAAVAHAANCARCQAMLGAVAQTTPIAPMPAPWWQRVRSAWLVPLTAAAAAVTLWMVVPGQRFEAPPPSSSAPPAAKSAPPQARDAVAEKPAPGFAPEVARSPAAPAAAVPPAMAAAPRQEQRVTPPPQPSLAGEAQRKDRLADAAAAPPAVAAKREDPQAARANETEARARMAEEPMRQAPAAGAAPAAAAAPAAPPPAAPAPAASSPALKRLGMQAPPREVVSPDPDVRWRISSASIELTVNGGSTWQPLSAARAADIITGSAPARDVCWLVGRGGLVLRSTDGRRFEPVPFPERLDLVAVTAADARTATVTTSDGRTFRTGDAGASWGR